MTVTNLSRTYDLVKRIAERSNLYNSNEILLLSNKTENIFQDMLINDEKYSEVLHSAEAQFNKNDDEKIVSELINLRIMIMCKATELDNLAQEIAQLFERKAIRIKARNKAPE